MRSTRGERTSAGAGGAIPRIAAAALLGGLLLPLLIALPAKAQERTREGPLPPAGMPLHGDVLGSYSWPITTGNQRAQTYFDQGARFMFAYATAQAGQSFAAAVRIDPTCAMCWWGEAWALGPYFNGGLSASGATRARELVGRARHFAGGASPVEQALIRAMEVRHGAMPLGMGASRSALDSAYAHAMGEVHHRFPDHPEVATLYADALMLLEPRRGVWPIEKPSVQLIHRVLAGVLDRDPGHPGACHAYVHATETTPRVVDAQRCADLLGSSIPGASHINHMPSHTYNRVGRWGDATRANVLAWETDQRAERGEGFAIYPSHNLHMLLFSAAMDGQSELALRAAREYGKYDSAGSLGFQSLLLTRFGLFDRVLELRDPPAASLHRGFWHFGRGLAHLRQGRADSATHHLTELDGLAASTATRHRFRVHEERDLLRIVGGILRGEVLLAQGRTQEGIAALEASAAAEDGLMYDEPEPLPLLSRDYLGAALLAAGRAADAERVYRAALGQRPNNGWSLTGLERTLRAQGQTEAADEVAEQLRRAWERADLVLEGSRF